jgi:branched-chain amino acid transport system permease protein
MIYFLIVVAWAAPPRSPARCWRRCCSGIADVAGKYYFPKMGAFIVYSLLIVILLWKPNGLVRRGRVGKA